MTVIILEQLLRTPTPPLPKIRSVKKGFLPIYVVTLCNHPFFHLIIENFNKFNSLEQVLQNVSKDFCLQKEIFVPEKL